MAVFSGWLIIAAFTDGLWLLVLPALLPLLNFSPWTGWLAFEEFDLLVLGALAGGYGRLAYRSLGPQAAAESIDRRPRRDAGGVLLVVLGGLGLISVCRGIVDAGGWSFEWFDGYAQPLNSLRAGKSLMYALALWPLLQDQLRRATPRACRHLVLGMQLGLTVVGLAVLWERAAYPGLLDFSSRYRTTALFWEMHVGGGAIDAYLALATPFSVWALWTARTRRAWTAAAVLALLTGHACLTTFSRGVYVGVGVPLMGLGIAWWLRRFASDAREAWLALARGFAVVALGALLLSVAFEMQGYAGVVVTLAAWSLLLWALSFRARALQWRQAAALTLTLALITEMVAVTIGGSYFRTRLMDSEHDFGSRLAHWRSGVGLLTSPADWLFGIGAGRLPASYVRSVPRGEFSGALRLVATEGKGTALVLSGPATRADLSGLFSLTQHVALRSGGAYRVSIVLRVSTATPLAVSVCEQHLLYPRQCQEAVVRLRAHGGAWQEASFALRGPWLSSGDWYAPRQGMFALSVVSPGVAAELASIRLSGPDGAELLANGDFSSDLARWFPAAEYYFLPWHIDNLILEVLIERGALGLGALAVLWGLAFRRLASASRRGSRFTACLVAVLFGAVMVGSVSSLMDVPRVAFLLLFMLLFSLQLAVHAQTGCAVVDSTPAKRE